MQRCAAPRLIARVGAPASSILPSALANASGLRVNCALMASARYSRRRLTASASSCVTIGAISQESTHNASRIAMSGPPPLLRRPPPTDTGVRPPPPPPPHPPPPRIIRPMPSRTSSTAPTSAASVVMSRTSRFFTWPSSWATTPWSSSRLHKPRSPRVTAMWESRGS